MTLDELTKFITQDMRMSHIYQPVMLIELLKNNGSASTNQIAKAILERDPTQVEYYSTIVNRMVGNVLTRNRKITNKDKDIYSLNLDDKITDFQRNELITLLESKINEYEVKREQSHWEHRRRNRNVISGSIRYEVLKRAKFKCELCGISAEDKSLEVDHIVPKSLGGKDDLSNYQALCYTCNAQKNNKDDTDFRQQDLIYSHRSEDCLFCSLQSNDRSRIIDENTLSYVIRDGFPVTEHHTLIIPKRHVKDYFELTQAEVNSINQLIQKHKKEIDSKDTKVTGYNIGMNCGESAGQTIFHCHVHLIPRRDNDVTNPRGGIRHVIPEKGSY